MENIWVFGVGPASDVAASQVQVEYGRESFAGFCVDDAYYNATGHLGKKIIKYSDLLKNKRDHAIFVGLGYKNLNKDREMIFNRVLNDGFNVLTLSPRFKSNEVITIGRNCLVLAGAAIQPHASIGDNVFIWSGATVCHHAILSSHIWVTAGATISGNAFVGNNVFLGANSTIVAGIEIGRNCFIGAGALVSKSLPENSVVIRKDDPVASISAENFVKFLDMNRSY